MRRFIEFLRHVLTARGGNLAMVTAFAAPALIIGVTMALQTLQTVRIHQELNDAADAAALAAVSQSSILSVEGGASNTEALSAIGRTTFLGVADDILGRDRSKVSVEIAPTVSGVSAKVGYSAEIPHAFNPFSPGTVTVKGNATAEHGFPKYIDFYLALDVSQSMGLAATEADMARLRALTFIASKGVESCEFACHLGGFRDYWKVAHDNGVSLRIDILGESVVDMASSAKAKATVSEQYRMGLYPFDLTLRELAAPTADLDSIRAAAPAINLTTKLGCCAQTNYRNSLAQLAGLISRGGNGLSKSDPVKFVFLVTDGVDDYNDAAPTPTRYNCIAGTEQVVGGLRVCTTCPVYDGVQLRSAVCEYATIDVLRRNFGVIDPQLCAAIKAKNVMIAVLYTTYLPVQTSYAYWTYVRPKQYPRDTVLANLRSCATGGLFFQATTAEEIKLAMQAMFANALETVRLTS